MQYIDYFLFPVMRRDLAGHKVTDKTPPDEIMTILCTSDDPEMDGWCVFGIIDGPVGNSVDDIPCTLPMPLHQAKDMLMKHRVILAFELEITNRKAGWSQEDLQHLLIEAKKQWRIG